jgi:hypothetical protein
VSLENASSNAEILGYLTQYGYDAARMGEGATLLQAAQQLQQKQKTEYGDQYAATATLEQVWEAADREYMRLVKLARLAFETNVAVSTKLGIAGRRHRTVSGWLAQAKQFYSNALADPAVITGLGQYAITAQRLQDGQALVQQVDAAYLSQQKEKGEAQQATKDRDAAFERLDEWLTNFISVARIALEDKPQLIEALGVLVLSQPRPGPGVPPTVEVGEEPL